MAQVVAGLLVAGGGLPLAAATASATPLTTGPTVSTAPAASPHSAEGKPTKHKKKIGPKNFAAAADGSTAASSYGLYANVRLLGAAAIGTEQTPKADWPGGPATATTASVGVPGLLSSGTATVAAHGDDLKDTAHATSAVDGLGLGTVLGLQGVSADLISSQCTGDASGVTATSTVTGLKLSGVLNATPDQPAANTVINVANLGTLTLNEQIRTTTGGKTKLVTNALHLKLGGNGGLLDAVGAGDVIAGHTECSTTNALVPTVSGLAPATGPTTGGTSVVITGSNFRGASKVEFDGISASYSIDSTTQITATAPAHAAGAANVVVTTPTPGGASTGTNTFAYVGAPTVTNVAPSGGSPGGGTSVTITGTGFSGAGVGTPTVKFGAANATNVTVNSPTSITATAPAGTGTVFVTVANNGGTSAASAATAYTYQDALGLSSISPTTGPITGGTTITATGTGFTTDSQITVDGNAVATTYVSATKLTAVTPATTTAGGVPVTVKRGSDTSAPQTFTYQAVPVVTAMTPVTGTTAGGTAVTITGTELDAVTEVRVDGAAVTGPTIGATNITFSTPAHAAGSVAVTLISPSGTTPAGTFLFADPAPVVPVPGVVAITSVSPNSGPIAGNDTVTVQGLFVTLTGTTVKFGANNATVVGTPTLTSITVTTPPGDAPGVVPVTVTTAGGTSLVSLDSTYTYVAATPTIGNLTPDNGPATGGTTVTVNGTNFTSSSVAYWGTTALTTEYVSPTVLRVTTPPGSAGPIAVTVKTGSVTSTSTNFTYNPVPTTTGISPITGPVSGGTEVTVTGSNFDLITSVQVGTKTVNPKGSSTASSLKFDSPSNDAGAYTVTLSGPGGTSLTAGTFVYTPNPAGPATVVPSSGPLPGGNQVTITGTGFSSLLALTVGANVITNYTVTGDTQITFTMPAGLTTGTVPIIIATAGGIVTLNYSYVAFDANITGVAPISGPVTGGTVVTITGTGFTGATGIRFGGTAGTAFSVNGAGTQITVTTPQHAAGLVNVVVVGAGNIESANTGLYTYLPVNVAPTVTALTPSVGPVDGGTQVTIYGTGLLTTTGVSFGGSAATNVTVINSTTILATSPQHAAGTVSVIVTSPLGSSTGASASDFTYVAANSVPVVDSMTPRSGPTAGGTTVVFRGLGMQNVNRVTFDGVEGLDLTLVSSTTLSVKTPAHTAGGIAVLLRNPQGTSSSYLFTYVPRTGLPTVQGLTPNVGPVTGGTRVTISGTGFDSSTTVTFDGVQGTDLTLGADVDDPSVGPEKVSRKASTQNGLGRATRDNDTRARAYRPMSAGQALSRWKAATSNVLTVSTPPHAGGPTTVTVTNSAGSTSFVEAFTFIPVLAATVTIRTDVVLGASKAIAPRGPDYSGLEVTACSTPDGLGSTKISDSGKSCVYTAADELGDDSFVMSVIDDLGQTSEQTVEVSVVEAGGTGGGGGGGNDTGDGDGDGSGSGSGGGGGNNTGDGDGSSTGGSGGNDTGGGLAFTGTPVLLIPGLALGLLLMLLGTGLLGAERLRMRRTASSWQPGSDDYDDYDYDEDGRPLMPAGPVGGGFDPQREDDETQFHVPDDVA
ncbi:IPT/TIG domain-containing protein [Kineosporia sp. NBRC 101731]|uniref:beta strand repeat-containing protein n=1 Tax=Kineosporia sp. NBRC 101731 TaxID=3032199 RepID=UPI0024A14815|nr:IPT/TIG domain-containing protein [Kineosporia sp. NBRC 101731]GLY26996.1 hypothetical protein Kisp02_03610 [Kineosporia sp. NBRC 101731]